METAQCTVTSATPINANANNATMQNVTLQETAKQTAETAKNVLNSFSDKMPCTDDKVKEATNFLNNFNAHIQSSDFRKNIEDASKKYNVPPKQIAQNFFDKCFGIVGDILGTVITTIDEFCHIIVGVVSSVANGAIDIVCRIANALARLITFNKTCQQAA